MKTAGSPSVTGVFAERREDAGLLPDVGVALVQGAGVSERG